MVFVLEVILRMDKKLIVLDDREIFLVMGQEFELEGIDEGFGVVFQNYCVELDNKYLTDFWDCFGVEHVAGTLVGLCNGKKSGSEESMVPRYSSISCSVYKVKFVK